MIGATAPALGSGGLVGVLGGVVLEAIAVLVCVALGWGVAGRDTPGWIVADGVTPGCTVIEGDTTGTEIAVGIGVFVPQAASSASIAALAISL
ncbi:MAG: hypothetical protein P8Z00_11695 [Anaerolineales bacterium]